MKYPKIEINYELCTNPEDCRKCVQVCPPSVLNITFTDEDFHEPKNWIIDPAFPQLCEGNNCSRCINICPLKAISISFVK